jgi:hypothetical protein
MSLTVAATLTTFRVLAGVVGIGFSLYANRTESGEFDFQKIPEAIFGQVVGGLFANWLKEGSDAAYDVFIQKLSEIGKDSLQQELQSAARKAYLLSTYFACQSCLAEIESERIGLFRKVKNKIWKDEDVNWLNAVKKDLQSKIKDLETHQFQDEIDYKTIFTIFDYEKLNSGAEAETLQEFQIKLKAECLWDLRNNYYSKALGQVAVPFSEEGYNLLQEAIMNGWEEFPDFGDLIQLNLHIENTGLTTKRFDWFALLCALFNEEYKTNPRIQAALHKRETAQIKNLLLENFSKGLDFLAKLENNIGNLTDTVLKSREESLQLHTTSHVKIDELKSLFETRFSELIRAAGLSRDDLAFQFPFEAVLEFFSTPPMGGMVKRDSLVNELKIHLDATKTLILYGSSGMGKSILSYQIIERNGTEWRSIDMRKLLPQEIKNRLISAKKAIEIGRYSINILIDDLNFDKETETYQKALGELFGVARQYDCNIIITSQNSVPTAIKSLYEISEESFFNVPALRVEEVKQLALIHKCPQGKVLDSWSNIVWSQTKGHPQLAHAQIRYLENQGWRNPNSEDFLSPPVLTDIRTEFRKKLSEQLSIDGRTLLYRLSIFANRFKRENAKAIGNVQPQISLAGEVFDTLVGPYIEPVESDYFRLSPLLEGNATNVFNKEEVRELNRAAADSILDQKKLTHIEFNALLLHGLFAEYAMPLINAVMGWLKMPAEMQKPMAEFCRWFCYAQMDKKTLPKDSFSNQFVRNLQFNIAEQIDPPQAAKIAKIWEAELQEFITEDNTKPKFLYDSMEGAFLQEVLFSDTVHFDFQQIAVWTVRLIELLPNFSKSYNKFEKTHPEIVKEHGALQMDALLQTPQFFFASVFIKCKTSSDVIDLISGFDSLTGKTESYVWELLKSEEIHISLLIDKIWLDYIDEPNHDWTPSLEQLDFAIQVGKRREANNLVVAASVSKAIIYKEYLHNTKDAVAELDACNQYLGYPHRNVQNYRAVILHLDKEDEAALLLWHQILPEIVEHNRHENPYFIRQAEISAFRLNDWEEVNRLALIGEMLAVQINKDYPTEIIPDITALSFRADSAIALWHTDNKKKSLETLVAVFDSIPEIPYEDFDVRTKIFYLRLGYMFVWMTELTKHLPPPAGFFSDPNKVDNLELLPVYTRDFLWLWLAQTELKVSNGKTVLERLRKEIEKPKRIFNSREKVYQAIRFGYFELCVKHSIRDLETEELVKYTCKLFDGLSDDNQSIPIEIQRNQEIKRITLIDFLNSIAVPMNRLPPFEKWKEDIIELKTEDNSLLSWINDLKNSVVQNNYELFQQLDNANESNDKRFIASATLSFRESTRPNELLYANFGLLSFDFGMWLKIVEEFATEVIKDKWLEICAKQAFALRSPQLNIPIIRAACNDESLKGFAKIANILLAAQPAVGLNIDQSMRDLLIRFKGRDEAN